MSGTGSTSPPRSMGLPATSTPATARARASCGPRRRRRAPRSVSVLRKARGVAVVMALLGLLALGTLMLLPPLAGYERYVIDGGSMGDTLPRGSIAYEEVV